MRFGQLAWLALLGGSFFSSAAWTAQDCTGMDLQVLQSGHDFAADPFPSLAVRVSRNNTNKGCDYYVAFNYGLGGASPNSRALLGTLASYPVQIYKDAARTLVLKDQADIASPNDALTGNFPENSGATFQDHSYRPFLDTSLYQRPGFYSQIFTVRLYRGPIGAATLIASRTLSLTYNQQRKIDVSLVDTGQAFDDADANQTLNFGAMATGAVRSCDAVIKYNAGYRLTISSANNGRMKHVALPDTITYTFRVNNATIGLTNGPVIVAASSGVSTPAGARFPLSVTIGSLVGKAGGTYRDTITLSVVSIE